MFDHKYPYTDYSQLNLDWFLSEFKTLMEAWDAQKVDYEQFKLDVTTEFNTLSGKFDNLKETVETFTTFVENYFENLDVQQEINNKLNDMVTDGTMAALLAPLVTAQVPSAVSTWLTENVDPVGSAVVVDSTLSISGAAADAETVGDKFDQVDTFDAVCVKNITFDNLPVDIGDAVTGNYSRNSGTNTIVFNPVNGDAYTVDLKKFAGAKAVVKFITTSTSGRLTALCDENGYINKYDTEGSMTADGFEYNVTDTYYMLYISIDPARTTDITLTVSRISDEVMNSKTHYVSASGSDTNIGSVSSPFATVKKALDIGAKNICVLPGTYTETLNISDNDNVRIFGYYGSYSSAAYPKPTFINGEILPESDFTESGGIYSKAFTTDIETWNKVFIDNTLDPMTSGSRPAPNAGLFVNYKNKLADFALTPVLAFADLVDGSFTWDGSTLYVKLADDTDLEGFTVLSDNIYQFEFTRCNNLILENIAVKYARSTDLRMRYCGNANISNCEFGCSLQSDNVSTDYSNTKFENCLSYRARNDGFNCHYYGVSVYNECKALYNGDDGESSHEYCEVIVNGGEYAYNWKGGHSPVNGCKFRCNNTYSHHNTFGIYMRSDGTYALEPAYIFGSLLIDNSTRSIDVTGYEANLINCKINNKNASSGGVINEVTF